MVGAFPTSTIRRRALCAAQVHLIKKGIGRAWSFDLGYMLVYQENSSGHQYAAKSAHDPAGSEE